jgi:hypothetical protein
MPILTAVILIAVGAVTCFFGKKLFRIGMALAGFAIGYYFGAELLVGQTEILIIAISIVTGIIGAVIFYSLYKFNYVLAGLYLGLAVAILLINAINMSGVVAVVVAIVVGIIGAVIGGVLGDPLLRLGTAFGGATSIVGGVGALAAAIGIGLPLLNVSHGAVDTSSTAGMVSVILVGILGAIGYVVQTSNDKGSVL